MVGFLAPFALRDFLLVDFFAAPFFLVDFLAPDFAADFFLVDFFAAFFFFAIVNGSFRCSARVTHRVCPLGADLRGETSTKSKTSIASYERLVPAAFVGYDFRIGKNAIAISGSASRERSDQHRMDHRPQCFVALKQLLTPRVKVNRTKMGFRVRGFRVQRIGLVTKSNAVTVRETERVATRGGRDSFATCGPNSRLRSSVEKDSRPLGHFACCWAHSQSS